MGGVHAHARNHGARADWAYARMVGRGQLPSTKDLPLDSSRDYRTWPPAASEIEARGCDGLLLLRDELRPHPLEVVLQPFVLGPGSRRVLGPEVTCRFTPANPSGTTAPVRTSTG